MQRGSLPAAQGRTPVGGRFGGPSMNDKAHSRLEALERVHLAHLPTPLEPLDRLSEELGGPRIWMKRDDCTGLLTGGNKTRKLEYLLADAETMGADTVITFGAIQSNHARQTAAACAKRGIDCHLILVRKVKWQQHKPKVCYVFEKI